MQFKTGKYIGDKQVYSLRDFIQHWRVFGFRAALKELRKKKEKYYFNPSP